jgi:hypothetical protein
MTRSEMAQLRVATTYGPKTVCTMKGAFVQMHVHPLALYAIIFGRQEIFITVILVLLSWNPFFFARGGLVFPPVQLDEEPDPHS